jgi:D-alanyl-D-alanine carboxypeptidase
VDTAKDMARQTRAARDCVPMIYSSTPTKETSVERASMTNSQELEIASRLLSMTECLVRTKMDTFSAHHECLIQACSTLKQEGTDN